MPKFLDDIIASGSSKVGIGVSSPNNALHISGNLDMRGNTDTEFDTTQIFLNAYNGNSANTSDNLGPGITWKPFYNTYSKRSAGILQIAEGNYFKSGLAFFTNNTSNSSTDWSERMRISMDGNVGIGTTSPGVKLEVSGDHIRLSDAYSLQWASANNRIYNQSSATVFVNNASESMRITSAGNVGIGTSSPSYPFSLENSGTGLISRIYNTNTDGQGLLIRAGATSSATRAFQVASSNDTKIMTVNSNGRVGIGITAPASPLHVYEDSSGTGTGSGITVENDGTGDAIVQYLLTGAKRWVTGIDNSSSDNFKISSSSDLGTDTEFTLDSSGNGTFAGYVSATQFRPTNIVTNKVVKFNGTQLDDANITDTGSLITLGSNTVVSGELEAGSLDINGNADIAGNLVISGTTALDVTANVNDNWAGRFENTNSGGYGVLAKIAGTSSNELVFEARVGSSTKMAVTGDGNATFAGDLGVGGAIHQQNTYGTADKGVFAPMVQGGMYATSTSTITGRLRIKVPAYKSSQMQTFYIDVYEYDTDRSATYRVSGYNYSDTNATWYNTSVVALFDSDNRDLTVRFGADTSASAQYVSIGEVNSTWSYPQVVIRDYASGYNTSVSEATGAFTIEFVTTDGATYNVNHDNNQPMANWSKIEGTPANVTNALPTTGGTMSGAIAMGSNNITGGGTITGTTLTGTSLDINGNADVSGTLDVTGNATFSNWVHWDLNSGEYSGDPRAVVMGYSGGNYGQLGYNIEFTSTSNTHNRVFNDIPTRMDLYDGILLYSSAAGSAGTSITWTELLQCQTNNFEYKSNDIFYNGYAGNATFAGNIGLGGATSPSRLLHIDNTSSAATASAYFYTNAQHTGSTTQAHVSIYSDHASSTGQTLFVRGDGTGDLLVLNKGGTNKLVVDDDGNATFAGGLTVAGNTVKGYATGTRTINSTSYTMIGTVAGDRLASVIELTLTGTSGNVVIGASFEITVMHSQDIFVKSMNGDYKDIKIKITSDNNEDFSIEAMHTTTQSDTPMEVCMFPKAGEICTVTGTDPGYSGLEHEHTAFEGTCFSASDNGNAGHRVLVNGELEASELDINGNADISGNITANGNINGDGSTNVGNMNNVTAKQLLANGASLKIGDQQGASITIGKVESEISGVGQNDATDVVIASNLTVTKKLLIQGELETETTTNTVIKDNVIQLNDGGSSANTKDSGIVIHRGTSQNVAIVWDEEGQTAGGAFRFIATGDTASSADVSMTPQNENGENVIGGASAIGFQDVYAAHFRAVGAGNTSGFVGDGSGVTNLNMSNASSGTLAAARGGTGLSSISTLLNSNVTSVSGNAGSVTNGVYTTGDQSIAGNKTFSGVTSLDGCIVYSMSAGSLDTTGFACAGLSASSNGNGQSALFTFECGGSTGNSYQRIVYACYNGAGVWNFNKCVDEGGNKFDVVAAADNTNAGNTITFTFKSRSGTQYYTPRVMVKAMGSNIVKTYT